MTRSSTPCEAIDLERDLVTTDGDTAALRRHRPSWRSGDLEDLDRLRAPDWAAVPDRGRQVFPPQQPFEL